MSRNAYVAILTSCREGSHDGHGQREELKGEFAQTIFRHCVLGLIRPCPPSLDLAIHAGVRRRKLKLLHSHAVISTEDQRPDVHGACFPHTPSKQSDLQRTSGVSSNPSPFWHHPPQIPQGGGCVPLFCPCFRYPWRGVISYFFSLPLSLSGKHMHPMPKRKTKGPKSWLPKCKWLFYVKLKLNLMSKETVGNYNTSISIHQISRLNNSIKHWERTDWEGKW